MIDENAFGLYVAYHTIENDEYALEREDFVARLASFRDAVLGWARRERLGDGVLAVDFGHAVYFELGEGDEEADLVAWLRGLRAALEADELVTVGALTHGSRWVPPEGAELDLPGVEVLAESVVARVAHSSEPLRKALYLDAATQDDEARPGFGPGLYADSDAIEALGKKLKNAPTPLAVAGGTYFRLTR